MARLPLIDLAYMLAALSPEEAASGGGASEVTRRHSRISGATRRASWNPVPGAPLVIVDGSPPAPFVEDVERPNAKQAAVSAHERWFGEGAPVAVVPGERTRDTQAMLERHASRGRVRAVSCPRRTGMRCSERCRGRRSSRTSFRSLRSPHGRWARSMANAAVRATTPGSFDAPSSDCGRPNSSDWPRSCAAKARWVRRGC